MIFATKYTNLSRPSLAVAPAYPIGTMRQLFFSRASVRATLEIVFGQSQQGAWDWQYNFPHHRRLPDEPAVPLTRICNISVTSSGVFPERWNQANIISLYKKGERKDPLNYRSVSLPSLFEKLLGRVVFGELFHHESHCRFIVHSCTVLAPDVRVVLNSV